MSVLGDLPNAQSDDEPFSFFTNQRLASMIASATKQADQHVKFVQTLNDFFDVGDTAESDAAKEAGK